MTLSVLDQPAAGIASLPHVVYEVHGVRIDVRSDDHEVLERIDDSYGSFRVETDAGADAVHLELVHDAFGVVARDDRGSYIRHDDDASALIALFDLVVEHVEDGLRDRGILAIHAGAVATANGAVIVAGPSGAGKTTQVLGLLRHGACLLSDELALIARDGSTVLPFPRALHVRPATLDLVPELAFLNDLPRYDHGGGSEWSVDAARLQMTFGLPQAGPTPLAAIVLLDGPPDPDGTPHVEPVAGAIAVMELLRGTPAAADDFAGVMRHLGPIVASVPCGRIRPGPLDLTAEAILGWAGTVADRS
jgi:hypothetical protein